MERDTLLKILMSVVVFLIIVVIVIMTISSLQEASNTIERCKAKGWDGAEFKSRHSSEMICSDFSQAELDAMPGVGE